MNRQTLLKSWKIVMIFSTEIFLINLLQPAWASITPSSPLAVETRLTPPSPTKNSNFDPPPTDGDPQGTSGGASRSENSCILEQQSLQKVVVPLVPDHQYDRSLKAHQIVPKVLHPILLIYLPKTSAKSLFLNLEDENENSIYQTTYWVENKTGVMIISLPASLPAIEAGKAYKWSVVLICGDRLDPSDQVTELWIFLAKPDKILANSLEQATVLEQISLYKRADFYYDALITLAELRQLYPDNPSLVSHWKKLLHSVGLGAFATEPLVQ